MSRASKQVYHPHGDANDFKTVEESLDSLDERVSTIEDTTVPGLQDGIDAVAADLATRPVKAQNWEQSWVIEFPDNKDYRLVVNCLVPRTITSLTTRSSTGTCTLTPKINTTTLGGGANSVSTSEVSTAHSSANAMAAGDDFVATVSSNSSCEMVSITISGTLNLS